MTNRGRSGKVIHFTLSVKTLVGRLFQPIYVLSCLASIAWGYRTLHSRAFSLAPLCCLASIAWGYRTLHSRAFSLAPVVTGLASKFAPVVASALELQYSAAFPPLAEVNFHDLLAGFVRNYDLFWHIASFLYYVFIFINSASERGAILRCANAG